MTVKQVIICFHNSCYNDVKAKAKEIYCESHLAVVQSIYRLIDNHGKEYGCRVSESSEYKATEKDCSISLSRKKRHIYICHL